MKPIIIIPTYNEKENIQKLLSRIFLLHIPDLEIIIVDDHSPDGTAELVKNIPSPCPLHLIERKTKAGIGSAYITGFKKALDLGADRIIQMDADLSHDPDDVPRLLQVDADLVIGSRKISGGETIGWGFIRTAMSAGAMWFSRLLLRLRPKDVTAGFRCFKRTVLETIPLEDIKSNGYAFQEEMLYRTQKMGFSIEEVPVMFIDRRRGKSKLSKKDIVEFFVVMIRLRMKW